MARRIATGSMTFVYEGEARNVALGAPMPVWRGATWRVRLIDLWVATMLPGDVFDLRFKILTTGLSPRAPRGAELDGMSFARGMLDVKTRELWWADGENAALVGCRAHAIVAWEKDVAAAAPPESETKVRTESGIDLGRILPIARAPYPAVAWRRAQ